MDYSKLLGLVPSINDYINPILDGKLVERTIDYFTGAESGRIIVKIKKNLLPFPRYLYIKVPYECIVQEDLNCVYITDDQKREEYIKIRRNILPKQQQFYELSFRYSKKFLRKNIFDYVVLHDFRLFRL